MFSTGLVGRLNTASHIIVTDPAEFLKGHLSAISFFELVGISNQH